MNSYLKASCLKLTASIIMLLMSAPLAAPQGTVTISVGQQGQFSAASITPHFGSVKVEPYSGEEITEITRNLADGNEITSKRVMKVYRDSEGRFRSELTIFSGGAEDAANGSPASITINDPVAGVTYDLNPHEHTARKSVTRLFTPTPPIQAAGTVQLQFPPRPVSRRPKFESTTEPLGEMSIEGLEAHGSRNTITYPAGMFGNTLPVVRVREVWNSTTLQVPLLVKIDDPRMGNSVTRLINISLDEPPASLFEVPSDYTILEEMPVRTGDAKSPTENMQ